MSGLSSTLTARLRLRLEAVVTVFLLTAVASSRTSPNIIVGRAIIKEDDNTITKVDTNVIDDGIVGIVLKDNKEIEGKLDT